MISRRLLGSLTGGGNGDFKTQRCQETATQAETSTDFWTLLDRFAILLGLSAQPHAYAIVSYK